MVGKFEIECRVYSAKAPENPDEVRVETGSNLRPLKKCKLCTRNKRTLLSDAHSKLSVNGVNERFQGQTLFVNVHQCNFFRFGRL